MKTHVAIVRDHSASMGHLANKALQDYNKTLDAIKNTSGVETYLSVINCAGNNSALARVVSSNERISIAQPLQRYDTSGGGTPLYDAVGGAISTLEKGGMGETIYQRKDLIKTEDTDAYLIMVITDGQENASFVWNKQRLANKINELDKTGRWTIVFRVPKGCSRVIQQMGIPAHNIMEWDQNEQALEQATVQNVSAVETYFNERSKGVTRSTSFYADLANLSNSDLSKVVDTTDRFDVYWVSNKHHRYEIRPYFEDVLKRSYDKGRAYYQLNKPEKVQHHKDIAIRDKTSGKIYEGYNAKSLLGLPQYEDFKLKPGDMGQYDLFVQSTSINRKIEENTCILYKR